MAEKDIITTEDLPFNLTSVDSGVSLKKNAYLYEEHTLSREVQTLERERIITALREHNYVQHRAARALGITPRQLGYRIKKYGIELHNLK